MAREYSIAFNNIIYDGDFEKLPNHKGIYMFRVTEVKDDGLYYPKVVYIGVAEGEDGLSGRVNEAHERLDDARNLVEKEKKLGKNTILTIAYTDEASDCNDSWKRIEATLIFCKKPTLNTDGKESFNYYKTTVNVSGSRYRDLKKQYIAEKTE